MGQKVHPYGFRLGYTKPFRSRWFAGKDYAKLLHEDAKLKEELRDKLKSAGVSAVEIERPGDADAAADVAAVVRRDVDLLDEVELAVRERGVLGR